MAVVDVCALVHSVPTEDGIRTDFEMITVLYLRFNNGRGGARSTHTTWVHTRASEFR